MVVESEPAAAGHIEGTSRRIHRTARAQEIGFHDSADNWATRSPSFLADATIILRFDDRDLRSGGAIVEIRSASALGTS